MLQLLDNRVVFPVSSIFPEGASFHIDQMPQLLNTFNHSVDTETAKQRVSLWIESGFKAEMMEPLLHAVIVTFGGGYRIWGRSSTHFIDNQCDYNLILKQAYVLASRLDFGCLKEIKKSKVLAILMQPNSSDSLMITFPCSTPVSAKRVTMALVMSNTSTIIIFAPSWLELHP